MQNKNDYQPFWANWYKNWRPHDVVFSVISLGMAILLMGVATATMYSSLINSGDIAYIENPFLAMALSLLSPAAGVTLKALPEGFTYKQSKDLYYKVLYSLTALAIVVWIYQFSTTVDGMGAALDIDDMLDSGDNSAYTFFQLIAEIFMGASLYSAWQNLHDSYTPKETKKQSINPSA